MSPPPASSKAGRDFALLFSTEGCHPTQTAVKTPLSLGFNSPLPGAGGCPLSPGGMEAGQPAQPTAGRGGERRGHLPCPTHMGRGLQCRKHQPQRQQHCSQGDRKERTRLDQSRLEQTPPTITAIHNPHRPPPPLPLTVIGGRMASKCRGSGGTSPAACGRWEWGSTHPNPLPRSAGNPAPLLAGEEVDLSRFAGCCAVFSCRVAVFGREQDTAESCSVTGGCCRGLKMQCFSRLLARTACAGLHSAEDTLRKGLGEGFSMLTVLVATTGVPQHSHTPSRALNEATAAWVGSVVRSGGRVRWHLPRLCPVLAVPFTRAQHPCPTPC